MTTGTPRAGARSRQLRRIADRRARNGRRDRAPLGARRPGQRRRAPERGGGAPAGAGSPSETWGQRAGLVAALLPGLAAIATLVFTWVSVTQVSEELTISQQGQSSDRYDKAIERLDKGSANIRRGAIFSLQGLMEDDPRMQPAVISALSEYIRAHASKKPTTTDKAPDIQAALSVLGQRDPAHDGGRAPDLRGVRLDDVDLRGADLSGANLSGAVLTDSNLQETKLAGADLHGTSLKGTNLRNASLRKANLRKADLTGVDLDGADLASAELAGADLDDVRLDGDTVWTDARRPEGDLPTAQPALSSTPVPTPASSRPGEPQEAGTT